jgi:hypothetical protein
MMTSEREQNQTSRPQLRHYFDNIWSNSEQRAKSSRGSYGDGPGSYHQVLLLDQELALPGSTSTAHDAAKSLQQYQESLDGTTPQLSFEQRQ